MKGLRHDEVFVVEKTFSDLKPTNLEICRFRRIAFGVISSPFLLTATVAYHLKRTIQEAFSEGNEARVKVLKQIQHQIYVDDLITGCTSQYEVIQLYHIVKETSCKASLIMRAWASNIPGFQETISKKDYAESRTQKVLEITWQISRDKLEISFSKGISENELITRRNILARLAQNYDPLGLLAPTNLKAKIVVQSLWKESYTWDQALPDEVCKIWKEMKAVKMNWKGFR